MAAAAIGFTAMKERTTDKLGNFYNYFIKSCTRILLPLSALVAIALLFSGTPMTLKEKIQLPLYKGIQ
jgi:K+-transporting ATPase ATPase A chain